MKATPPLFHPPAPAGLSSGSPGPAPIRQALVPLPRRFYQPAANLVARRLLGHLLVRRLPGGVSVAVIVETEAYLHNDPSCHAWRGQTERNRSMFGPPGHAYVYFIYGNHWCVNAVCRPAGIGEAVLVRALQPVSGLEGMRRRRAVEDDFELANGPAKLCQALGIDRALDGADLCDPRGPLLIAANRQRRQFLGRYGPVVVTTRVGITQAAHWPLRFYLEGSPCVSRRDRSRLDRGPEEGPPVGRRERDR